MHSCTHILSWCISKNNVPHFLESTAVDRHHIIANFDLCPIWWHVCWQIVVYCSLYMVTVHRTACRRARQPINAASCTLIRITNKKRI